MNKFLLILIGFFCFSSLLGQEWYEETVRFESNPKLGKVNLRFNATVPSILSNQAFSKRFVGIAEGNVNVQFLIKNKVCVGIAYKDQFLKITNRLGWENQSRLEIKIPAINVGYLAFHQPNIFSTFMFSYGRAFGNYSQLPLPSKGYTNITTWESGFAELAYSLLFFTERNLAIGFNFALQHMEYRFEPTNIALYNTSDLRKKGATIALQLGAGIFISLEKKR